MTTLAKLQLDYSAVARMIFIFLRLSNFDWTLPAFQKCLEIRGSLDLLLVQLRNLGRNYNMSAAGNRN